MARYRMYIDESGDHIYPASPEPAAHRYLSLTGVCVEDLHYRTRFVPALQGLKDRHFPTHPDEEPVILVRRKIIDKVGPFRVLRDPERNASFDCDLLKLLEETEFRLATMVLDKFKHRARYSTPYPPYNYCMQVMLEKYESFLNWKGNRGDVMAESRNSELDLQLKAVYRKAWEGGTNYVTPGQFQRAFTTKELKVKKKEANVAGLQLADLLAAPGKWHVLREVACCTEDLGACTEAIIEVMRRRYVAYGLKLLSS